MVDVLTRSYDSARTGANTAETQLTPASVGANLLVKLRSLSFDDDPRLEAQPLYVANLMMSDGRAHDVLFVCTMANNVWAFDVHDGTVIWKHNMGLPLHPPGGGRPGNIDLFGINILWGIVSTPVIDRDTNTMYLVAWLSPDQSLAKGIYYLHAIDITSGHRRKPALVINASMPAPPGVASAPTFQPSKQKQRAALLLTQVKDSTGAMRKAIFVAFSITHEEGDSSHGWLLAYDVATFTQSAAWCTTPSGTGSGIWQAGHGPATDANGNVYVLTGNYGEEVAPPAGDFPETFVKLAYTPPTGGAAGQLAPVAWFTPFHDADRNPNGDADFQDFDLGSAGPVVLPGMGLVVGAGKDGVLYVLGTDTSAFGSGSDFTVLKQPPIFFTYFPGFGIDASNVHNLDHLYDGKTHHLHTGPVFWQSPTRGPMLFDWGENESLRAWTISAAGKTAFVAKGAEVASAGTGGIGGMPGGILTLSSNGSTPNTGIVWSCAPLTGDANRHVVQGILRAYDAETLDPVPNADGTPRLKLLWDSNHIPNNTFNHCKFCPPVVADGMIFVPTYDGRVDIYGLRPVPGRGERRATNATRLPKAPKANDRP